MSWNEQGAPNNQSDRVLGNKVNLIVAVSSRGYIFLSCTQVNTDDQIICMFLSKLAEKGNWRDEITFILDGAAYHRSVNTRRCLSDLRMQVVLSAPYSYAAAPAELWFSILKRGDFNPLLIRSTKS